MTREVKILGLSGSLRKGSANTAILNTVAEGMPAGSCMDLFPLDMIPAYNSDQDGELSPPEVVALREAVKSADGVLIGSPEYNYGMSGVLKNALDWISRPHNKSNLVGKPVLTFTASPAFTGGVRAHQQLNETLLSIGAQRVVYPQIVIGTVFEKVKEGRLVDEAALTFLLAGVEALVGAGTDTD